MTDGPTPASHGGDGRPVECTTTSNPSSTLPLLYDLDALSQIPAGESTKDIPPAPIGEFTKPRKSTAPTNAGEAGTSSVPTNAGEAGLSSVPTNAGEAGPSSVPDGAGDQDEESDDASSCSDDEDEDDPRPRRGAGPRTLEEKLRGERAFIEDLLDEDELEDLLNMAVPREQWKAADFVEEDIVYACVDVLVMEAMRHLKTLEAKSTLKLYTSWIYHYKRREYKIDAETNAPVKSNTVHMILGRIKACQMAARVEATLFKEKELGIMREISVVRSEVRVMVRTKNQNDVRNCADRRRGTIGDTYTAEQFRQIMMRVLPTWVASAWNPRATTPSQTLWRFLLVKVLTLLSHHSLLRGASIREITLPDIFLYRLASTSSVNPENQPVVMVIAARNSKTSKDARLQQSYAARHLEAELCAVGETGLWLHFILDQIRQFHGVDLIPPVDTSTRERWYKKHLFFARNDEEQMELPAASHQRWTRQMWKTNGVFCKRNVHAARAGGAQELAIDGTSRAEIAELGHWAIDKMTRAYITAIPVGVVMKKAGYSGAKQDYFLGRSRVEPGDELLALIAEYIFPGVDDLVKKIMRRIVVEDLAVKLVRTPWHPYVQYSKLCRIPLFQHWAKRVEKLDTETIKKRRDPTLIQPEEISVRLDAEHAVMSLTDTLKYERERSAVQKIDLEEDIEKRDAIIATLTAEITRLTEALRVSEARRMPEASPAANEQSPRDGGSADSASTGSGAKKPPKPPQTVEEASYELNVVQPWRDATTVRDAWRLWTSCTSADTRRLCDRFAEPGFVDRHTLLKGATQGALEKRVRRMMKVIDAVHHLRRSDGEADTEAVVAALNKIVAPGIGTFSDALTVLNADAVATYSQPGKGVKGLGKREFSKLRVACAFVARGLKPEQWVADLFPDTWKEQMKMTLADMAGEDDGQLPPTKKSPKRKKTA
ncbi:unnamed protein product [Closterium sp. Naga37s-1]|nr:unnamed protein product [Closterium sp. Naga37s-1]